MTRNHEVSVLAASAIVMASMFAESVPQEPLSQDDGQALVKGAFRNVPFWTGAWGNDVSCILPMRWTVHGKGDFTYFSAAEHRTFDGMAWELNEISSGKLRPCKHEWSPAVDIWFTPEQLFEVECFNGKRFVCYHNERMRGSDATTAGIGFIENHKWNGLGVSTNGCPVKTLLAGWPESLFADAEFKSICSVVPFCFRGAEAETVHERGEIRKRLDECAAAQNAWTMTAAQKNLIADKHRRYVSENRKEGTVAFVHIVVCDANHDEICDAYATSDREAAENGKYRWSLYLGSASGFSRQEESARFSLNGTENLYCEANVVATKEDFFRVDRIKTPSYVMVLTGLDGHPESLSYVRHENPVRDFRRRTGFANAEYYSCLVKGNAGVSSIRDLFLSCRAMVRAERLQCETIDISGKGDGK